MNKNKENFFILNIVTAFENRGDLLINRALIQQLRMYGKIGVVTKNMPKYFLSELELCENECYSSFTECMLQNRKAFSIFKVGIPGHSFESENRYLSSILEVSATFLFKIFLGVKFVRVGTSFGSMSRFKILVERIKAKIYTLYGVRDQRSKRLVSPSKTIYFPDLAFLSDDIITNSIKNENESYVYLSFRNNFPDAKVKEDYIIKIRRQLESFFSENKYKKIIIGYQVPEDEIVCKNLFNHLEKKLSLDIKYIHKNLDLKEAIKIISGASVVISNRLHVLLPALIAGIPHIGLTDLNLHKKISDLYESINAKFALHDVNSIDFPKIVSENNKKNLFNIAKYQRELGLKILDERLKNKIN